MTLIHKVWASSTPNDERISESLYDPLRHPHCVGRVLDVLDRDSELVAAKAG
jgi:hypothetical protein